MPPIVIDEDIVEVIPFLRAFLSQEKLFSS